MHSAKDHSDIYVSKSDPKTLEKLEKELDNEDRYSKRFTAGIVVRERFTSKVICIDCSYSVCNQGMMPLWHDKPPEIKCGICGFIYYPLNVRS